jgi:hypothetical protein
VTSYNQCQQRLVQLKRRDPKTLKLCSKTTKSLLRGQICGYIREEVVEAREGRWRPPSKYRRYSTRKLTPNRLVRSLKFFPIAELFCVSPHTRTSNHLLSSISNSPPQSIHDVCCTPGFQPDPEAMLLGLRPPGELRRTSVASVLRIRHAQLHFSIIRSSASDAERRGPGNFVIVDWESLINWETGVQGDSPRRSWRHWSTIVSVAQAQPARHGLGSLRYPPRTRYGWKHESGRRVV